MRFDWSTPRAATHSHTHIELAIRSYLYLENCEIYLSEVGFPFNADQLIDKLDWEIGY